MFQSIDSCISPSWYRNKTNIHKFVLERRFSTVHVCDPLRSIETRNGRRLTDQEEEKRPEGEEFEDKSKVSEASEPYVDIMLNSIAWLERLRLIRFSPGGSLIRIKDYQTLRVK